MDVISVCLEIDFSLSCPDAASMDKGYQSTIKHILSFLYEHPRLSVSVSFSGPQLSWLEAKHPEALRILSELAGRHQIEVLGGGYYSPLFPLLLPVDRSGQIEKLTSTLVSSVGKRPRGMSLYASAWDPSLVTTLQSCGMEYVHLESSLIPAGRTKYLPVITGELGKTIRILPTYREFIPSADESSDAWLRRLSQTVRKEFSRHGEDVSQSVVTIPFSPAEFLAFSVSSAFSAILSEAESAAPVCAFTLPLVFLKNAKSFVVSYIPAGMGMNVAEWAAVPYRRQKSVGSFPLSIHDYLHVYPQNRRLYERMMHMSVIVSQYHGDKARRSAAREKLWCAQAGWAYVMLPQGSPAVAENRQLSYRALNEADGIIRADDARESLSSYDYNADGLSEYVCSMEKYTAVISPKAGAITELDVRLGGGNYAANLSRIEEFDGVQDDYQRGIFVEHLFEGEEKDNYLALLPAGSGIFSRVQFVGKKCDAKRHEVQLEGRGEFSSLQLPVSLRKNYIATSSGITVQYILKNESPLALKALFVVESNFAQTVFSDGACTEYEAELIHEGQREPVALASPSHCGSGVSALLLTNTVDRVSFVFEPNEDAGFAFLPVSFKRPSRDGSVSVTSGASCVSFFWDVDLAAGMEMEKTVSISFVPARKKARPKKSASPQNP